MVLDADVARRLAHCRVDNFKIEAEPLDAANIVSGVAVIGDEDVDHFERHQTNIRVPRHIERHGRQIAHVAARQVVCFITMRNVDDHGVLICT